MLSTIDDERCKIFLRSLYKVECISHSNTSKIYLFSLKFPLKFSRFWWKYSGTGSSSPDLNTVVLCSTCTSLYLGRSCSCYSSIWWESNNALRKLSNKPRRVLHFPSYRFLGDIGQFIYLFSCLHMYFY